MQQTSANAVGASAGGFLGLLVLGGVVANVISFYTWPWVTLPALGFLGVGLLMTCVPELQPDGDGSSLAGLGLAALLLSFLGAFVAAPLVGGLLCVTFKTAGAVIVGLFGLGVLLLLAGKGLRPGAAGFHLVLAGVLGGGLYLLPAPPGSPEHEATTPAPTRISVTVTDAAGAPIPAIVVRQEWRREGSRRSESLFRQATTDAHGRVIFDTTKDPTGRIARIWAEAKLWDYQYPGPDPQVELRGIRRGETRAASITVPSGSSQSGSPARPLFKTAKSFR